MKYIATKINYDNQPMVVKWAPTTLLRELYDYNEIEDTRVVYVDPVWLEEWWQENHKEVPHAGEFVRWVKRHHPNGVDLIISLD